MRNIGNTGLFDHKSVTYYSNTMEPKQEINQIISNLPDELLAEVVQYLRQVEKASQEKARLSLHLQAILLEDSEVLARLAK